MIAHLLQLLNLQKFVSKHPSLEPEWMLQEQKASQAYADRIQMFTARVVAKYAEHNCTPIYLNLDGYRKLTDIWVETRLVHYPFPVLNAVNGEFVWTEYVTYRTGLGTVIALAEQGYYLVGLYEYANSLNDSAN